MSEIKLVCLMLVLGFLLSRIGTAMTASFLQYEQRIAQESFDQALKQARETVSQVQNVHIAQK